MKRGNPKPLTPKLQAELDAPAAMPESEIDSSDMLPIADRSQTVRVQLYRPVKRPSRRGRTPNRATREAIRACERGEVFRASSIEELMADLKADD